MERQSPQDLPAQCWYGTPGVIEHWFYGVFAGGGAKGIAYSGALLAMKNKNCWFSGVAGASAGAITAALVASGLSPEEIENATDSALRQVQTGDLGWSSQTSEGNRIFPLRRAPRLA